MAQRKNLINTDYGKNEIQKAVVHNLASAPSSPKQGQIYYDTTLNLLGVYNDSAWLYFPDNIEQAWGTYADTITWSNTAPSGTTSHEYAYVRQGRLVCGFIRLEFTTGGSSLSVKLATKNNFPAISFPANATNNGDFITSAAGYIDTSSSGSSPPLLRGCWLERATGASGFVVKIVHSSQISIKTVFVSFTYLAS